MRKALVLMTAVAAAVLAPLSTGWAQTEAPSEQDMTFLKGQQEANLVEISLGKMVMDRAATEAVRTLAAELVSGHEAVMQQNMALSKKLGVALPQAPNDKQLAMAADVQSKSGTAFDTAYVNGQVEGHKTSVSSAEKEIASGTHPEVKAFATEYLPKAQMHLRMAQEVQSQLQAAEAGGTALPRTGAATGLLVTAGLGLVLLGVLTRAGARPTVSR